MVSRERKEGVLPLGRGSVWAEERRRDKMTMPL